jgi:hypothetical protein
MSSFFMLEEEEEDRGEEKRVTVGAVMEKCLKFLKL